MSPQILSGREFAHYIQLPAGFKPATQGKLPFMHFRFRKSPASPDLLFVTACKLEAVSGPRYGKEDEICSESCFVIDTAYNFNVREASLKEWSAAVPVESVELDDPVRRTYKTERLKPPELRGLPQGPQTSWTGYKYRGQIYSRRADWVADLRFAASPDGSLVVLRGLDRRGKPKLLAGRFTLDFFVNANPNAAASIDFDCSGDVMSLLRAADLVDSRWVAIGLDFPQFRNILLLDFKSAGHRK